MGRLLRNACLSALLYLLVFGVLTARPLTLGLLELQLAQKTTRLAALPSPKLVIVAGSNGPYSHSCVVIGTALAMPCENAGIAVGIGLDTLFANYAPLLHRGDVVYMPMELAQYTASAAQVDAGVDGALLLRDDRAGLEGLPPGRMAGALLCCTLGDFLESLVEMPLAARRVIVPARVLASQYNVDGDRIDNDLSGAVPALLSQPARPAPRAGDIDAGYGQRLIAGFVRAESAQGVTVIGGLPTDFSDVTVPPDVLAALSATYAGNGGAFLALPTHSQYPREDFFNSEDHLAKPCQYWHSLAVGAALAQALRRVPHDVPADEKALAATCPSARGGS